jgi:hypothetical protein
LAGVEEFAPIDAVRLPGAADRGYRKGLNTGPACGRRGVLA